MATKDISDEQVCRAFLESRGGKFAEYPYEILERKTGECHKVCYSAMKRADRRGLVECGVSLRTGWLTDKGVKVLGCMNYICNPPHLRIMHPDGTTETRKE